MMTELKQTLRLLEIMCGVFLALAYIVSINMEVGFIRANSVLISNDFWFACFSGAFSSAVVLIVTNVKQSVCAKKVAEQFLFDQLALVYAQMLIVEAGIDERLSKRDIVPDNLLQMTSDKLYEITASFGTLDYNPIWTNDKAKVIKTIVDELLSTGIPQIELFARGCKFLKIAIIRDRIDLVKNGGQTALVTSTSLNTGKTLKCLKEDAILLKRKIETNLMRHVVTVFNGRKKKHECQKFL